MTMHKLLWRQLQRHWGLPGAVPAEWHPVLAAISAAYQQADADRALLERAMELTSQELLERNQQLRQDMEDRQQGEAAIRLSERRYRQLFERNFAGVYRTTVDGRILDCNAAFIHILGYASREELVAQPASALYFTRADRERYMARLQEQRAISGMELCLRRKNGSRVWVLLNATLIEEPADHPGLMEGTLIDITERKALEQQLEHQAFHDALTQLPNRALFTDRLQHALVREGRHPRSLAVLFLDLDRFKLINDSLGHEAGDHLIRAVAQRLTGCLRREDTVARFGGDEFAILLEDVHSVAEATATAERILGALQAPLALGPQEVFISASIGIVFGGHTYRCAADVLRDADSALYRAKSTGKGRCAIFDVSMNAHALARLELESQMRHGLERGEFEVYYQPLVTLATGAVISMEALVRWRHPQRGLIAPAEFIPLAEETGLICPLGQWVLAEACRQARYWQEQAPAAPRLGMSVNLSAREFQQPELVAGVARILDATGVDAGCVQLEITESVIMDDAESSSTTLRRLKALGVQLAIDDFGTGYSSLSYLKRFPVDTLKIDRTFVRGLESDVENQAIVQAVISLAQALHMAVVAEGVETAGEVRHLCALGCPVGQGYFYAPPLEREAANRVVATGTYGRVAAA